MPSFATELLPLNWLSAAIQKHLGHHFHVNVAPPGDSNWKRGFDFPALFHPHDSLTVIGTAVDAAFNGVEHLPAHKLIYFSLRDRHHRHHDQIDIAVEAGNIIVSPDLPPTWIKFGYAELIEVVWPDPPLHQQLTASMAKAASLNRNATKACYHYPSDTIALRCGRRPDYAVP